MPLRMSKWVSLSLTRHSFFPFSPFFLRLYSTMSGIPFSPFRFPPMFLFSTVPSYWKPLHIRIVPFSTSLLRSPWSVGLSRHLVFRLSIFAQLLPTSDLSLLTLPDMSIYVLSFRLLYCRWGIFSFWTLFFLFCQCLHTKFCTLFLTSLFSQYFSPSIPSFITVYNWLNVDLSALTQSTCMSCSFFIYTPSFKNLSISLVSSFPAHIRSIILLSPTSLITFMS